MSTPKVLAQVAAERVRQNVKWGEQNHPDGTGRPGDEDMAKLDRAKCQANAPGEDNWRDILQEEVSEAFAETHPAKLRAELVQVAAVAVSWIEAIDRRPRRSQGQVICPAADHCVSWSAGRCPTCGAAL